MNENKLVFQFRSFDKNTIQARRSKIPERVVFSSQACCEDTVHIHVRNSVGDGWRAVAEQFVNGPDFQSLRHFFVLTLNAVASFVLPLLGGRKPSVFGKHVIVLCRQGVCESRE